jgi:glycosyltransferase involved in cell wall biosynthesis
MTATSGRDLFMEGKPSPKYSICVTSYNNAGTVRASLESILSQIDGRFEVVVVDSESDDGTFEILQEFVGRIKLVKQKCSRGRGRQIAFENSSGNYIISNMDMDDIFKPNTPRPLLVFYHSKAEGRLLRVAEAGSGAASSYNEQAITVAPSSLLEGLGGWRDINQAEDWELWARAAKAGRYSWTCYPMRTFVGSRTNRTHKGYRYRFWRYRQLVRVGRARYDPARPTMGRVTFDWLARISMIGQKKVRDPFYLRFDHKSPEFYIPFEELGS